jgi:ribosome-associated protein
MNKPKLDLENNLHTNNIVELKPELNSKNIAYKIAEAADDRKGEDILLLNVQDLSFVTDYFVLITGFSQAQLKAISDSIEEKMETEFNKYPIRIEGKKGDNWILHDYGDVIVHIFMPKEREFYDLEAFWGAAEKINFSNL